MDGYQDSDNYISDCKWYSIQKKVWFQGESEHEQK